MDSPEHKISKISSTPLLLPISNRPSVPARNSEMKLEEGTVEKERFLLERDP